ncbi:hypothetical protein [Candidatus Nasuia deltocephalinicola]|uniref:hypothetical protein n=1 Tax=Candidatus Nasuia deltocephalincola TaxID=1160784 RepID=UPI00216B5971|nr:hypothetical protein [Candidatus Nasuia deltocephalinicola]
MNKLIFSPIKFIKKYNCCFCHNFKKNKKILPNFYYISKIYKKNYKTKKYLFKKIKYGSKNIFKKNILMPSFLNIKKKYIYYFIKWLINFYI